MNKVEKIKGEIERRYEYWKEKESNSHSIESESRMSECNHLLSMIISLSDTEKDFSIKESVIPFGASDSELMEETIYIPQGFHAVIEGDKVIIRKGEESVCRAFQIDGEYTNGGFTGLLPAWIDAPSTLQPAHKWHGRNVVAVHEKNGGFRCCLIDEKVPFTFHLPENTGLVSGWKKKPVSEDLEKAAIAYNKKVNFVVAGKIPNEHFMAGALWKKQQLMENAVEAVIHPYDGEIWVDKYLLSIYNDCQRVKLIIIEEE